MSKIGIGESSLNEGRNIKGLKKQAKLQNSGKEGRFFIGTSGWTYHHWKSNFYPERLAKSRWFEHYAGIFSSVEVNATFYRSFSDKTYLKWKERAPDGFGFVFKAPRFISHRKYLVDVAEDIQRFYKSCALLEEHFEMILLQLAPNTPYDVLRLKTALEAFLDPGKVAVEFRNPLWYTKEVENVLKSLGASFVNVDSPNQELTGICTSERAYIRLHGRSQWYMHNYSAEELAVISRLAGDLLLQGARRVYIFFNNDFKGYAPANALTLRGMLEDIL